jgi:hypothetical protein
MMTWLSYSMIIDQFNVRLARHSYIDPDFLSAADKFTEFYMKVFREKFNFWGPDFYIPGRGFKAFSFFVNGLTRVVIGSMLLVHLLAIGIAVYTSFSSMQPALGYGYVALSAS